MCGTFQAAYWFIFAREIRGLVRLRVCLHVEKHPSYEGTMFISQQL